MSYSSVADSNLINNYISTQSSVNTPTSTESSKNTLVGNYDTFLKILTAQLKNQDPTKPMDASEFTQQLVQYSAVEQQIATNDKLDDMLKALNSNGVTPLLSYIGQYTESKTKDQMVVQDGKGLLSYDLPTKAQLVTISIKDSAGKTVATIEGLKEKGLNRVSWDGKLASGATAPDGVYKFVLTAKDSNGATIEVKDTRAIGRVTAVETGADGVVKLKLGDLDVADTDVVSVFGAVSMKAS